MELPSPLTRKHLALLAVVVVVLAAVAALLLSGVITVSVGVLGGTGDPPPQGSFHFEGDSERVTIVRDVGKPVNASKLEIRVGDQSRGTWYDLANETDSVEQGARLRIENVESGDLVGLYWTGGAEPRRLQHHEVSA